MCYLLSVESLETHQICTFESELAYHGKHLFWRNIIYWNKKNMKWADKAEGLVIHRRVPSAETPWYFICSILKSPFKNNLYGFKGDTFLQKR